LRTAPILGSEVRKKAVSLCFVKSACVPDPDLILLTLKHSPPTADHERLRMARKDVLLTFSALAKSKKDEFI
jgi:hypothetical protein